MQSVAPSARQPSIASTSQVKVEEHDPSIALGIIEETWNKPGWKRVNVDSDDEQDSPPLQSKRPNHWPMLDPRRSFVVRIYSTVGLTAC